MTAASRFSTSPLVVGFRAEEFSDLPPAQRRKILRLMAQACEATYRRGLQHGDYFARKGIKYRITPLDLRFGPYPLSRAPWPNGGPGTSSLERLEMECGGGLCALGFLYGDFSDGGKGDDC